MALPIISVKLPAALAGQSNGRLSSSILVTTAGLVGGPNVRLVKVAMRSWLALTDAAKKAGHVLKATSYADSYRTYDIQVSTFLNRYVTYDTGNESVVWGKQRYWRRDGVAVAAVPGTSNHGWALAVDCGEERDGDSGTESIDAATVAWLSSNEIRFGFSHELQSEPWHIRYWSGDTIPKATLDYENSNKPSGGEDVAYTYKVDGGKEYWVSDGLRRRIMPAGGVRGVLNGKGVVKDIGILGVISGRTVAESEEDYGGPIDSESGGGTVIGVTEEKAKEISEAVVSAARVVPA